MTGFFVFIKFFKRKFYDEEVLFSGNKEIQLYR